MASISIIGRSRRGQLLCSYTAFEIEVRMDRSATIVRRRYSDFAALDGQLRLCMPSLPRMPPKGTLWKLSHSFMVDREHELGKLLEAMLRLDPSLRNPELRAFLELPPLNVAKTLLEQLRPLWLPQPTEDMCTASPTVRPSWLGELEACLDCGLSTAASNPQDAGCSVETPPPNFTGSWVLARVEGDMESLLKELDLPWVMRKAAAAAGYGVGKAKAQINQYDERVKVENVNPIKSFTRVFATDGLEHDEEQDGKSFKTIARWEGSTLITDTRCVKPNRRFPQGLRYMSGEEMVVQTMLADGGVVKQFYVLQTPCDQ